MKNTAIQSHSLIYIRYTSVNLYSIKVPSHWKKTSLLYSPAIQPSRHQKTQKHPPNNRHQNQPHATIHTHQPNHASPPPPPPHRGPSKEMPISNFPIPHNPRLYFPFRIYPKCKKVPICGDIRRVKIGRAHV